MTAASLAVCSPALAQNAYVANLGGSNVSVFDTKTDSNVAGPFAFGNQPIAVAVTPDGSRAYVANLTDATVSVIDTKTNTMTATITLPSTSPEAIAITPDGTRAYVSTNTGEVDVIDTRTNAVVGSPIAVGGSLDAIAITPDGTHAYLADQAGDVVDVLDTQANALVGLPIALATGANPRAIAISPSGARAYVTDNGTTDVEVIDTATNAVLTTVGVGSGPWGIGITPDGGRAYVVNDADDTVSAIDTASNTTIGPAIPLPGSGGPRGLAISPNGAQAYAVSEGARATRVIDTASNTQVASIPAGGSTPNSIAVAPDQPPLAKLSAPGKGMLTSFRANASTDSDGRVASYDWDFGDGSTARGTSPTFRHAYADPGEYTVKLTLTDEDGCSTKQVFTGQTALCNGSARATAETVVAALRLHRARLDKRHGTATLAVAVPGRGVLKLTGRGVVKQRPSSGTARSERKVAGKGTVKLRIKAKGRTKRKLRRHGRAKVRFKVTFTPSGGSANTQTQSLTLVKRHRRAR